MNHVCHLLVAVTSALAAFYLIGRDAKAVLFGLIASGALGFLAFIDISFNLLHGLYAPANLFSDSGLQMEAVINVGCVVGATWSIWRFWGHPLRRAEDRVATWGQPQRLEGHGQLARQGVVGLCEQPVEVAHETLRAFVTLGSGVTCGLSYGRHIKARQ